MKAPLLLALGFAGSAVVLVWWLRSETEPRVGPRASPGSAKVRETIDRASPVTAPERNAGVSVHDSAEMLSSRRPTDVSAIAGARQSQLSIPESQLIEGVVLDEKGNPALDAQATFYWLEGGLLKDRVASMEKTGTGRFSVVLERPALVGVLRVSDRSHESIHLEPVRAGARELVLRLLPARRPVLDVRDENDEPVRPFGVEITTEILGHRIQEPFSIPSWKLPPVPFRVFFRAEGFAPATFGPIRPMDVGDVLLLRLARVPRIRGRVTCQGTGVMGAFVQLGCPSPEPRDFAVDLDYRFAAPGLDSMTDEAGNFEIPWSRSGWVQLRASKLGLGIGRTTPFLLDAGPPESLEIVLQPMSARGTIRGRMIVPQGRPSDPISVLFEGPEVFRLRPEPDGSFDVDALSPGTWRLRPCLAKDDVPGLKNIGSQKDRRTAWLDEVPPVRVELAPGAVTTVELDLMRPALCRLSGIIDIEGVSLADGEEWVRRSVCLEDLSDGFDESLASLRPDGTFWIAAHEPASRRLRIEIDLPGGQSLTVLDRVEMLPGTRSWVQRFSTGSLIVRLSAELYPAANWVPKMHIQHRWAGHGELRVVARQPTPGNNQTMHFECVPAGPGEIVLTVNEDRHAVLVDVPAGGVAEVELR